MKIYLVSDIHVEFLGHYPLPSTAVDLVILAGDIHVGAAALDVAADYARRCNAPVILVPGNHEFYRSDMKERLPAMRRQAEKMDGVHFLEKDAVVIHGVRFLGSTLWSDFKFHGYEAASVAKERAGRYIADFNSIRYDRVKFTPDHAEREFDAAIQWLDQELGKPFAGTTVVITHFLPHPAGVHSMHRRSKEGGELTPYFTSDCSSLMRKHSVQYWLYGHTHNSVDTIVEGQTRLVSNQLGYPQEPATYTQFDENKIIEIT